MKSKPQSSPKTADGGVETRLVALDLLQQVLRQKLPLDQVLAASQRLQSLRTDDRGLARLIVLTALRRLGEIDYLLKRCLKQDIKKDAQLVFDILRLGAAQLLYVKTAPHAAIHTSVELCARRNMDGFKSLVNAILRRLQSEAETMLPEDPASLNTPPWLWQSWVKHYGEDVAAAIAAAHLIEPPLDISVKSDPEAWAEKLGAAILPNGTLRQTTGGLIGEREGFDDGAWWVQDVAASLPVRLMGNVSGQTVIDLCAAPGGKTAQLLSFGARVIAVDRSEKRLEKLQQNLCRLQFDAELVCADAAEWRLEGGASHILLDAPCSATGTIRRHPDIPWLKSAEDVSRLADLQRRILANAASQLRPGGILVYAVCSLQPEEGPQAIEHILSTESSLRREKIGAAELPGFADLINSDGDLRSLPCDFGDLGGMDGFYAARLRKQA